MGLDQYFYVSKYNIERDSIKNINEKYSIDIADNYWIDDTDEIIDYLHDEKLVGELRKHANLQGYITDLVEYDINTQYIPLDKDVLENIKELTLKHELLYYTGFFWGKSDKDKDKELVKIINTCLEEIDKGNKIYYYSWY